MPNFIIGELFCGPGGLALGAKRALVRKGGSSHRILHGWATDYDRDTCYSYRSNICPERPGSVICADIRKIKFQTLARISKINALAFGFPCNDFSIVGRQRGMDGVYGPLYHYAVEALKFFKPIWFLAENVNGLRNSDDGRAFGIICSEMAEAGYALYPNLYKFEQYGVPQSRHRIIIVGIRKDQDISFAIPSTRPYLGLNVSCRKALEEPPISSRAHNNEQTKQSPQVIRRLNYIKPGENAFTAQMPEDLRLKVLGAKISQIYKRLDPDKPAYTITGSGGGGTHVYHWRENRALTNRERARLQTFPDNFYFCGSKESVRKQIGMAVPPRGAKIIFEAILKTFAHISYESVPCNMTVNISKDSLRMLRKSRPEQLALG